MVDSVIFSYPIDAKDFMKALDSCAKRNHLKIASLLLDTLSKEPAEMCRLLSCEDLTVINPLYAAIENDHEQYVELFLTLLSKAGCSDTTSAIFAVNHKSGLNSLELAARKGNGGIVATLLDHIPVPSGDLLKPLNLARKACHGDIVDMLLDKMNDNQLQSAKVSSPSEIEASRGSHVDSDVVQNGLAKSPLIGRPDVPVPFSNNQSEFRMDDSQLVTRFPDVPTVFGEDDSAYEKNSPLRRCPEVPTMFSERHSYEMAKMPLRSPEVPTIFSADDPWREEAKPTLSSLPVLIPTVFVDRRPSEMAKSGVICRPDAPTPLPEDHRLKNSVLIPTVFVDRHPSEMAKSGVIGRPDAPTPLPEDHCLKNSVLIPTVFVDRRLSEMAKSGVIGHPDSLKPPIPEADHPLKNSVLVPTVFVDRRPSEMANSDVIGRPDAPTPLPEDHRLKNSVLIPTVFVDRRSSEMAKSGVIGRPDALTPLPKDHRLKNSVVIPTVFVDRRPSEIAKSGVIGHPDSLKPPIPEADHPLKNCLHLAVKSCDVAAVIALIEPLKKRPKELLRLVRAPCPDGQSTLHLAARFGCQQVVQALLEGFYGDKHSCKRMGQLFLSTCKAEDTPLHVAAACGNVGAVDLFLNFPANGKYRRMKKAVVATDGRKQNALHKACSIGSAEITKMLLDWMGGKPEFKSFVLALDSCGRTSLHLATMKSHHKVVKMLLESVNVTDYVGQLVCAVDVFKQNCLHFAAGAQHVALLMHLLRFTSDAELTELVTTRDCDGYTPLHIAVCHGHLDVIHMILSHIDRSPSIYLAVITSGIQDLFELAVACGLHKITELLLSTFAKWEMALEEVAREKYSGGNDKVTYHGIETYVVSVLKRMDYQKARLKIQKNVNNSWSGLQVAAYFNHVEVIQSVLDTEDRQIFFLAKARDWNALHLAAFKGHVKIISALLNYLQPNVEFLMHSLTSEGLYGWNALHLAAYYGHRRMVSCLLGSLMEHPAALHKFLSRPTTSGWNALHLAVDKGHASVVSVLLASLKKGTVCLTKDAASTGVTDFGHNDTVATDLNKVQDDRQEVSQDLLLSVDEWGRNCLHIAACNGRLLITDLLLKAVCSNPAVARQLVDTKDGAGLTAMELASTSGNFEVAELISRRCDNF